MNTSAEAWPARDRAFDMLRSLVRTFTRVDMVETAAYVLLSLASALAGSLAAVLLVPLVQPGHALTFAGGVFAVPGGVEMQAAIFAAAKFAFAVLRWLTSRQIGRASCRDRGCRHV